MRRKTWFKDEDYHLSYEVIDDMVFAHITFERFSKSIYKDVLRKFNDLKLTLDALGWEYVFSYTKDKRVIRLAGGAQVIGKVDDYEVVAWDLKL